ncbi:MAG: hypothetical protein ACOY71_08150 [Gemmatimonadota bacterium]
MTPEEREELLERLMSELDRTFTSGGHAEGLRAVRRALASANDQVLEDLAYQFGLDEPGEEELEGD